MSVPSNRTDFMLNTVKSSGVAYTVEFVDLRFQKNSEGRESPWWVQVWKTSARPGKFKDFVLTNFVHQLPFVVFSLLIQATTGSFFKFCFFCVLHFCLFLFLSSWVQKAQLMGAWAYESFSAPTSASCLKSYSSKIWILNLPWPSCQVTNLKVHLHQLFSLKKA